MGPLTGVRVIEMQGIGPAPFCGMMLSDMGAEVVRIDRAGNVQASPTQASPDSASPTQASPAAPPIDVLARGRRSLAIDLKNPDGVEVVLRLIETADGLIEGFRPGVMERLGLGPDECAARNPKLVYGRMTGWGQEGPYSQAAGHDINYIALAGALEPIGRQGEAPVPPLNLVGDFGGGGMLLAFGMACALHEAQRSGQGQVVDAAMVDGAATLMAMFHSFRAMGIWNDERGTNMLDTGSHFYDVYECADAKYVSIGAIEPQFYAELLEKTGLDKDPEFAKQMSRSSWPQLKERLVELFLTKTRDQWCEIMEASDICFAPVLSLQEAPQHPHNVHRNVFTEIAGVTQPSPAPRFSRTPSATQGAPRHPGQDTDAVLADIGYEPDHIAKLHDCGAVA